jgi:zinc and cadmium transporter
MIPRHESVVGVGSERAGEWGAVGAAALFLLLPERMRRSLLPMLISFATGTLLASALLELLPHAIAEAGAETSLQALLGRLVLFYLSERLLRWRHYHELGHCDVHQSAGALILIGDRLHNFVDGITITAGFLVSVPVGIATSLAIVSGEASSAKVSISRDLLMSQFWQNLQARLQPAVPNDRTGVPGRK